MDVTNEQMIYCNVDQHFLKEVKTKRKNVAMALIETINKLTTYDPANMGHRISENVQDIRISHKIHHQS